MLLAPEGDPNAPDIPTPRSYAEAIVGEYSSLWQIAMDAEMGVDFFETFSPTPKMTTLWVLLHVAAQCDYELHSLDFSTAFLQDSLHEEIWLRRSPNFTGSFPPGTQSLPPLPTSPASPCLPCVEGRQRATPQSSSFPPMIAPLKTLHMDMWGPAHVNGQGHERYFLLVVDDYTRYTTIFPLRSKGEVPDVLIPWIHAVGLQLRERFREDLPVLHLLYDIRGEFSSDLLQEFVVGRAFSSRQWTSSLPALFPASSLAFPLTRLADSSTTPPRAMSSPLKTSCLMSRTPFTVSSPTTLPLSPPPLLFLAPGPPPVDSLPPQGPAPSGVSQVDPLPGTVPVEVVVYSGAARGAASRGGESGGAEPGGAESGGAEPGGAKSEGGGSRGAEPWGAEALALEAMALVALELEELVLVELVLEALCGRSRTSFPFLSMFLVSRLLLALLLPYCVHRLTCCSRRYWPYCSIGLTPPYAIALVPESESASPQSVEGEFALGSDILEDRQEDFEFLAATVPRFASMLLALEGDPDAPDIPAARSYEEAITGPYSSQWQAAMDTEMASWKSTGTYVNAVPPSGVNIVDGMWIFWVKRLSGSPR
ncbi:unnamed protein product [Closterium sp. NIES-54]